MLAYKIWEPRVMHVPGRAARQIAPNNASVNKNCGFMCHSGLRRLWWLCNILLVFLMCFFYVSMCLDMQAPKHHCSQEYSLMLGTVGFSVWSGSVVGSPIWVCASTICDDCTGTHFSGMCPLVFKTQDQGTLRNVSLCNKILFETVKTYVHTCICTLI